MEDEMEKLALKALHQSDKLKNIKLERTTGGVRADVYLFEIEGQKRVIKLLKLKELYSEVFYLQQAEKVGANVPHVYTFGQASAEKGFYTMDFIEGHKEITSNLKRYLSSLVDNIKKIQDIKLKGFGRYVGNNTYDSGFAQSTLYEWIEIEIGRLQNFFVPLHKDWVLEVLSLMRQYYPQFIKNTNNSVLVHGDLGIRNTFFDGDKTYIYDAGPTRAMPPLWEVAHFDNKYFKDPNEEYIGNMFKNLYFADSIKPEQEQELAFYRAIIVLNKYEERLHGVTEKPKFIPRVERNIKAFKDFILRF